jgi:hypothetical protein
VIEEGVYYPPTDPEMIKAHMDARRQAVRILLAELTMLSERLRNIIGPAAWLEYMGKSNSDVMEEVNRHAPHNGQDPR